MFSILTRLKEPNRSDIDLVKKMRLYDGESVEGYNSVDLEDMKKEFHDEGMSGIDPRYVINRISSTIIRKNMESINSLDVLRSLKEGLDQHPSISAEDKERYMNFISAARKEYDDIAKRKCRRRSFIHMKNPRKLSWTII